jgi:hypothetical protein
MRSKCWLSVYWVTPERQPRRHGIHHNGRLDGAALEKRWEKTKKANVIKFFMQFLDVENAFDGAPYDQIMSSYFKEDVADTSAVPGEPG